MSVAVLLALLLGPLLVLVVRRRWMAWVIQQQEMVRLVRVASAEAARDEAECCSPGTSDAVAAAVGGEGGAQNRSWSQRKCAVCYSPTTTRCSRCKAVRYCSGKCQIVHWRQGHKEECHPPPALTVSNTQREQAEERESNDNCLDIDRKEYANPVEALLKRCRSSESNCSSELFSEDDCVDGKPSVNTSASECSSDSSSSCTFSGPVEPLDDASAIDNPDASFFDIRSDSLVESLPQYTSLAFPKPAVKVNKDASTRSSPSDYGPDSLSVNNISCSVDLGENVPTSQTVEVESSHYETTPCVPDSAHCGLSSECQDAAVDSRSIQTPNVHMLTDLITCRDGDVQMDAATNLLNLIQFPDSTEPLITGCKNGNLSGGPALVQCSSTVETRVTEASGIEESGHVAGGKKNDAGSLNSEETSSSFASPVDHVSFQDGGPSSLSSISSKSDNSKVFARLSKGITTVPSGDSDMNTMSVVNQQGGQWKSSRQYPLKMLFPYELFVKLYHSDKVEFRPCGLTNCGNSCYANVVLQCLAFTPALTSYLLEGLHTKSCAKNGWCFTCEFEILLTKAKQGVSLLSPIGIISQIKNIGKNLGRWSEEDAHEFLRYAIDAIQSSCLWEAGTDVLVPVAAETTLIKLIFGGYLQSKIRCMRCLRKSERCERLMDLTVEIHGNLGTLEEALARFTATEILDGENKYLCSRCNSYEQAEKKLTILEAPNVLTIALKRYQSSGKYSKINKTILFPERLNLAPYTGGSDDRPLLYSLYAVVVHLDIMNSSISGHYICCVKNPQGRWFEINDSVVKPVDICRVLAKDAYMLFYARCSPNCPSVPGEEISEERGSIKKSKSSDALPISHCRTQRSISTHHDDSESCSVFDKGSCASRSISFNGDSSRFSSSAEDSPSSERVKRSFRTSEHSGYLFGNPDSIRRTNLTKDSMSHSAFSSDRTAKELTEQCSSRWTARTNISETKERATHRIY